MTVLFLNAVGSTTLSQHQDPEDIHAVMDGALARCKSIVEAHQGKVLQYAGDSLLAVFGAGEAHEDAAERAVHAGLALLDGGARQGQAVARRHGHDGFNVRVGVLTGGVLLGGGVDSDSSIRGMTVNVAARMEQTPPPGGLRISQDRQRQVRGLFDLEPQAALLVKGGDEPTHLTTTGCAPMRHGGVVTSRCAKAITAPPPSPPDRRWRSETASTLCAVEELLAHLQGDADGDATQNMRVRLTCFRVLERAGDARAIDVLSAAHMALQARAASFGDSELRRSFLANVPEHHAIVAAWAAHQAGTNPP